MHPKTVSRTLIRGRPASGKRCAPGSLLDPFRWKIDELVGQNVWNGRVIVRELQAVGYEAPPNTSMLITTRQSSGPKSIAKKPRLLQRASESRLRVCEQRRARESARGLGSVQESTAGLLDRCVYQDCAANFQTPGRFGTRHRRMATCGCTRRLSSISATWSCRLQRTRSIRTRIRKALPTATAPGAWIRGRSSAFGRASRSTAFPPLGRCQPKAIRAVAS